MTYPVKAKAALKRADAASGTGYASYEPDRHVKLVFRPKVLLPMLDVCQLITGIDGCSFRIGTP